MNGKELIQEMAGVDETNLPKSFVGIFHEIWNEDGVVRQVSENTFYKPTVEIFQHLRFLQIDFKFKSPSDQDLAIMWKILEKYCASENSFDDSKGEYPLLTVNIVPKKYNGKYYLLATNPMIHTLQPNTVNSEPTVIRMVFADNDFTFFCDDESETGTEPISENTQERE